MLKKSSPKRGLAQIMLSSLVMVKVVLLFTLPEKMGMSQGAAAGARWADPSVDKKVLGAFFQSNVCNSGKGELQTSNQTQQALQGHWGWRTQYCQMISRLCRKPVQVSFMERSKVVGGNAI